MKRMLSVVLAAVLGCTGALAESARTDTAVPPLVETLAEGILAELELEDEAKQESAAALTMWLEDVRTGYFPGTAGSSLTAAVYAGRLLDWGAETPLTDAEMETLASAYAATLTDEDAAALSELLEQLYYTAQDLSGAGNADLLASAGYEPLHDPWDPGTTEMLFAVLGDGLCQDEILP